MTYDPKPAAKKRRMRNKLMAIQKLGGRCSKCFTVFNDPEVYDFHHKDEGEKEHGLSYIWGASWMRIRKELKKCILMCANCHRIQHKEDRDD